MKTVYLVRHGESVENAEERYIGDDAPLTAVGVRQANYVAERFASIPFDIVLTSTMERAKETGRAIAERSGKPIEHHAVFKEFRRPSEFHGKAFNDPEVKERWPLFTENINDPDWHYSDEENYFDITKRAREALAYLAGRPEENIVVATHGTFLKICTCLIIAGEAFSPDVFLRMRMSMKTRNTGITVCEYNDTDWKLLAWNDYAHLGDPKKEDVDGASL